MTEATSRRVGSGMGVLLLAVGFAWAVVAAGQAFAPRWIARIAAGPPMAETLFNFIVFAPLFAFALIAARLEGRSATALGVRPAASGGLGLVAGVAGLCVAVGDARLAGVLADGGPGTASPGLLLWGAAVIAVQVVAEEVYFRGWLQAALARRWGWGPGIVAGALAFAALHVAGGARGPVSLVNLFLGGVMFGLFAARGGGIAAAIGAHFGWNATEQLVWGLDPNPGVGSFGAVLDKELVGRAIWGGSADGLNGSVGMTVALLAILAPLAAASWRRLPVARAPALSPSGSLG